MFDAAFWPLILVCCGQLWGEIALNVFDTLGVRDNDLTLISFYKRFHLSSFRIIENKLQYIKFVNVEKSHRLEGRLV